MGPQPAVPTAPSPSPGPTAPKQDSRIILLVLGALAALFASGLLLLYGLRLGGTDLPLPQQPSLPSSTQAEGPPRGAAADALTADTQPGGPTSAVEVATLRAEVAVLQTQLAAATERLDALSAHPAGLTGDTVESQPLVDEIDTARATAETVTAEAAQAVDSAQPSGSLAADSARLDARVTAQGLLIRLDESSVAFAPGRRALPASAEPALEEVAALLQRHPDQSALLRGHTDATGAAAANLALSRARAAAVRDALIGLGVPAERLEIEGVGPAEPIADNASPEGRRRNRRVDILLSGPQGGPQGQAR